MSKGDHLCHHLRERAVGVALSHRGDRGVGVAGSLSQMERDLAEIHAWAWPENTPGVEFVFDLPEEVAEVVIEYRHEKELAETHAKRAAELAVKAAKVLTSHWSEPDTARVMGLSKQRVHQLKVSV